MKMATSVRRERNILLLLLAKCEDFANGVSALEELAQKCCLMMTAKSVHLLRSKLREIVWAVALSSVGALHKMLLLHNLLGYRKERRLPWLC